MLDHQKIEKIKEAFGDKAFLEKVMSMESTEEVQKALAEKGADLSLEELEGLRQKMISKYSGNEELDAEQLKNVAGGSIGSDISDAVKTVIDTTKIGFEKIGDWFRRW